MNENEKNKKIEVIHYNPITKKVYDPYETDSKKNKKTMIICLIIIVYALVILTICLLSGWSKPYMLMGQFLTMAILAVSIGLFTFYAVMKNKISGNNIINLAFKIFTTFGTIVFCLGAAGMIYLRSCYWG